MMNEQPAISRMIVLIDGGPVDEPVVEVACLLAKQSGAQLYLVRPIVVERSLALDAPLPEATESASAALTHAAHIASVHGCTARTRELRTRDVAAALVDEAADLGCDLILLGISAVQYGTGSPMAVAEQILRQAPCPVWLYHRPRR